MKIGTLAELDLAVDDVRQFTFKSYHPLLDPGASDSVCMAAFDGTPGGLALWQKGIRFHRLLSIRVRPELRRRGIAAALMQAGEARLGQHASQIAFWSSALPGASEFRGLLGRLQWTEPKLESYRCILTPARVAAWSNGRMLSRVGNWIRTYEWQPWGCLTDADHEAIADLAESGLCPSEFTPAAFLKHSEIHSEISMLLKRCGKPIGWCLVRVVGQECWYENYWTHPDYRRRGIQVAMLLEMIARQGELFGPDSIGRFVTTDDRPEMMALCRGAFQGCFIKTDEFCLASKGPKDTALATGLAASLTYEHA